MSISLGGSPSSTTILDKNNFEMRDFIFCYLYKCMKSVREEIDEIDSWILAYKYLW